MKVQLIKSSEVDNDLFTKVVDFLQSIPGVIQFQYDHQSVINFDEDETFSNTIETPEDFTTQEQVLKMVSEECLSFPLKRRTTGWNTLFKKIAGYRKKLAIPHNEFAILLTSIPNDKNWFAALDESMPFNGFIHTEDWEYYINSSPAFPIAYEVIALMLQKYMFEGNYGVSTKVHEHPIGCVNDLCMQKNDIILKLRTGDICESCIELLNGKISIPELHHALHLMSSLREKMLFAQNLKKFSPLSKLVITSQYKIFLPDFGNIEIKLRPLEKAIYLLFLRHPEGIYHSSLSDHRQELYEIYSRISTMGDLNEMKERIDDMVNALSDSASQKISRIKRVFEESIGSELAQHYMIKGEMGLVKKISLPRELVVINN